jgi:hypothetical protein
MEFDENSELAASQPRRFRIRFSLLALLLFVTLVCIFLAWLMQPNRVVATAIFHVSREQPTLLGDQSPQDTDTEFEITKKSQIAAIQSHFVLQAALRKPGISTLAILASREDPTAWLADNLTTEFPEEGEYLSISLEGVEEHSADLQQIVDAVAKAYSDEVLFKEKQRRLMGRDVLSSILNKLHSKIQAKWEVYAEIARESDIPQEDEAPISTQIILKQIERIESELMRLEGEQLRLQVSGETENSKFYEQRIAELKKRNEKLMKTLRNRIVGSPTLSMRKREIDGLEKIADEISTKLERLEIEANASSRIEQVQQAVVSPAD